MGALELIEWENSKSEKFKFRAYKGTSGLFTCSLRVNHYESEFRSLGTSHAAKQPLSIDMYCIERHQLLQISKGPWIMLLFSQATKQDSNCRIV